MLKEYFENILKNYKAGDTTEASFYVVLQKFIESFAQTQKINLTITPQPKRGESGIPDFVIRKGKELIGYIEAKDIGKDLESIEFTEQIEKYKNNFDNFILTNYFDFWLWRGKEQKWVMKVRASKGELLVLKNGQVPPLINEKELGDLLNTFLNFNIPERKTAKLLAKDLASKARLIPSYIIEELNDGEQAEIVRIYEAFKHFLIADLSKEQFADIYSQTIAYGLFMARLQHKGSGFNRFLAQQYLPKTITVLKDTFSLISGTSLPNSLNWIIDDIATILAYCDIDKIKSDLKEKTGGNDPLIHFYETFLKEYNPKEKKHRGVYYTPLPIVSYITRSINLLLKEKFGKTLGFADSTVTILDPASGTLTFPANAIEIAENEIAQSKQAGSWLDLVKSHILKDFYAFELLMAPYIIGHLKAFLLLENLGYKMQDNDRFNLFLTNSLDFEQHEQSNLPGFPFALTEESKNALEVKNQKKILVVMGNPPYSGISRNTGNWILEKIKDYKLVAGKPLGERNPKWLQDDYVKFFRFAQWKIEQADQGILGFITNHAWLDNPTFRGMRYSLIQTFDEIYILNLHGNFKKKEKTPQGKKDENVFDIQQGVSIALMVKCPQRNKPTIKYLDLWGLREEKYNFLETRNIKNTKWQDLEPKEPYYFLIARNPKGEKDYEKFISVAEIFPVHSVGIVTARDNFVIDSNKEGLKARIDILRSSRETDELIKQNYGLRDKLTFLTKARRQIQELNIADYENCFTKILYRPFDERWIFYHSSIIERTREEVMNNMLKPNLGLIFHKREELDLPYTHFLVTENICEHGLLSGKTTCYEAPLYLYSQNFYGSSKPKTKLPAGVMMLFDAPREEEKKPNIKPEIIQKLCETYKQEVSAEDIFYYIYGVLYSNVYRQKYNEFLKIDFPKAPFTTEPKLFFAIAKIGKDLTDLHLLKSLKLEKPTAKFPKSTSSVLKNGLVEKRNYQPQQKRIYINDEQYFEGIEADVWHYHIGGYQILDKWLKDRVGKRLSFEEVGHYLKIITVLQNTINLQKKVDELYPEIEKNLMQLP